MFLISIVACFFCSSRRRHTRCALVTGVQTCALPISRGNTRLNLTVALSYGGRAEITRAVRRIAAAVQAGELDVDQVDENLVARNLLTEGIPDPDLLIRPSGEQRISNFMLWQTASNELLFLTRDRTCVVEETSVSVRV